MKKRVEVIGIVIGIVALLIAALNWLVPFEPIGLSPFNPQPDISPTVETKSNLVTRTPTFSPAVSELSLPKPTTTSITANPTVEMPTTTVIPTESDLIASDVPGTPLEIGVTIYSVIDRETKPRDVYSVQLTAGQTLNVIAKSNQRAIVLWIAKPGFTTFEMSKGETLTGSGDKLQASFVAAVSGTYYLMVEALDSSISYELTSSIIDDAGYSQIASDVPGTPLEAGATVSSAIDRVTKPRDVYSVQLTAGQTLNVIAESNQRAIVLWIAKPGFTTFEMSKGETLTGSGDKLRASFVAAVSGTYYLMVEALDSSISYKIKIIIP